MLAKISLLVNAFLDPKFGSYISAYPASDEFDLSLANKLYGTTCARKAASKFSVGYFWVRAFLTQALQLNVKSVA